MDRKTIAFHAFAFIAGIALGWAGLSIATPNVEIKSVPETRVRKAAQSDQDEADLVPQLRRRIEELEARLKESEQESAKEVSDGASVDGGPRRDGFRERRGERRFGPPTEEELEKLKVEDPEQYTRTTNRIARMERHFTSMMKREAEKRDIIANIDTSLLTTEQQAVHARFQELQNAMDEMRSSFRPDDESLSDEDRRANFEAMRQLERELREAAQDERTALLTAAAGTVGLEGDDAADFVDTIKAVYEATQTGRGGPGGPPPPMP